jgi:hypothetical protein
VKRICGAPHKAELEQSVNIERPRTGMKAARARGIHAERKPRLSAEQIEHAQELPRKGKHPNDTAAILKCSRATVYRAIAARPAARCGLKTFRLSRAPHARTCWLSESRMGQTTTLFVSPARSSGRSRTWFRVGRNTLIIKAWQRSATTSRAIKKTTRDRSVPSKDALAKTPD